MEEDVVQKLNALKNYIDAHCSAKLKISQAAEELGLTDEQLETSFKILFNTTAREYKQQKLLEKCAYLIALDVLKEIMPDVVIEPLECSGGRGQE